MIAAAASLSDVTPFVGAAAALVAAIGGVWAAFLGVNEYRLKSKAQRVEIDVQLSKLLAELVPIANGRGGAEMNATVGEATEATAIVSIGYLGGEHSALNKPARQALDALDFVDDKPKLRAARERSLELIEGA